MKKILALAAFILPIAMTEAKTDLDPENTLLIDLKGGQVVRLAEGDMDRATVYGDDPAAQAMISSKPGTVTTPSMVAMATMSSMATAVTISSPAVRATTPSKAVPVPIPLTAAKATTGWTADKVATS